MAEREYRIQAPDGSILRIVGPDDATNEQLQAAAQRAFAARAPAEPVAPAPAVPTPPAAPEQAPATGMTAFAEQPLSVEQPMQPQPGVPRAIGVPEPARPAQPTPSVWDRLIGELEAAGMLVTGATTGPLSAANVAGRELAKQIIQGSFGTPEAMKEVERALSEGYQAGTYMPRTPFGQEAADIIAKGLQQIPAYTPIIGPAVAPGAAAVRRVAGAMERPTPRAPAAMARIEPTLTTAEIPTAVAAAPTPQIGPAGAPPIMPVQAPQMSAGAPVPPPQAITPPQMVAGTSPIMPTAKPTTMRPTVAPLRPAPTEILVDESVRARPSSAPLNAAITSKRDVVLDAIGIPADSRRLGARTGDKNQIKSEIMLSKLDGADRMRQQLDLESQRLAEYAAAIQRDTGGTAGATPLARGEAISAPLEGYQNWYNAQIKNLYSQANAAAAGQGGIRLDRLKAYLTEPANFKGDGRSVSRDMQNELIRLGVMNKKGVLKEIDAQTAEVIRQEANRLFDPTKPQTKNAVAGVKNAIDEDVLSVLPADVYREARAMRTQYREIFEDPKGIAEILDISGPEGINRAVSLDVLPDKLANYAAKNTAQFNNIIRTLETLPTPELQNLGKKAMSEVRAHIVEKIISKNIDPTEAALGGPVVWRGTDDTLSRQMAPYRGKTKQLLGDDLADRLETLRIGARILRPFDPNPSGTATTAMNLQSEFSKKAITAAGGLAGAGVGAVTGGPAGAAGGAITGAAAAKKVINVRQQRAIDKAIEKSLKP